MDTGDFIQTLITVLALIVTYLAAIKGAEQGARLGEAATISREVRDRVEEQKRQIQQINAIRLLLALEMRQNIIDLRWLWSNITGSLGEEQESYYQPTETGHNFERHAWLEARQRFVALYMPDWTHRCWHGQQSSYLASVALKQLEIRQISRHHSELDRLTKIKNMLADRASKHSWESPGERAVSNALPDSDEEAARLWKEFVTLSADTLIRDNPLNSDLKNAGVEALPPLTVDALIPGSTIPAQIEARDALAAVKPPQLEATERA